MTSSVDGVDRTTRRVRDRIVGSTSSTVGAHSSQTVAFRRLLDRLEQGVGRLVGEPVGVLDDHHLPAPADRSERRGADQLPDLVDADRELLGPGDPDVGVRADGHLVAGVALAAPAALALQRRREREGGVGPSRARRAGEQPRVGHLPGRGADHGTLEPRDHPRWPTSPSQTPVRVPVLTRARPRAAGTSRACTASAISSDVGARVHHEVVVGIGLGQPQEAGPHTLVELDRLSLDPVAPGEPGEPGRGLEVEQHGQVGTQVLGGPAGDPLQPGDVERTAGSLVGEGRVDVAVGDHDLATGESRTDDRVDVLGLVGGVQQRLGAVGQRARRRVEHDAAYLVADRGAAGLAGQQYDVPVGLEPLAQQLRLRGLAGPFTTLEADEDALRGVDAGELCGHALTLDGGGTTKSSGG